MHTANQWTTRLQCVCVCVAADVNMGRAVGGSAQAQAHRVAHGHTREAGKFCKHKTRQEAGARGSSVTRLAYTRTRVRVHARAVLLCDGTAALRSTLGRCARASRWFLRNVGVATVISTTTTKWATPARALRVCAHSFRAVASMSHTHTEAASTLRKCADTRRAPSHPARLVERTRRKFLYN